MTYPIRILLLVFASATLAMAADGDVVFRSDVSLVRVDAQVVDRDNRAITGLRMEDFVLREGGQKQEIRNFASEDMPVDVLLLLDVSGSMRPHIQRIASAAHQALRVLGDKDRIAIMVFDRYTRVRLTFRSSHEDVEREFERLLHQETFNGGTDITRAMLDAAEYIGRQGRRDARRAIVILTDDQTELERNDAGVSRALERADAVMSALLAPYAMPSRMGRYPGGGRGRGGGGGSWPGGGGMGGPLGGIILGRRGGYPGGGYPGGGAGGQGGPMGAGGRSQSAGTAEIARQSGGDSLPVDDASALETTLARIRQRYALHFHLPEGVKPGQERTIEVSLSDAARGRYPDAEVRYRRAYLFPGGSPDSRPEPIRVTRAPADTNRDNGNTEPAARSQSPAPSSSKRRSAVNESDGPRGANPSVGAGGDSQPAPAPVNKDDAPAPSQGGFRRLKPGEQP